MSIEAMKLALDALEEINKLSIGENAICLPAEIDTGMDALRQAIAEAEQVQPVVWMYQDKSTHEVRFQKHMAGFVDHGQTYETPLYTTPPQRKPLTDEEISRLWSQSLADTEGETYLPLNEFARAIEAKLRRRNEQT